jgi:colanic acid/amylovoran biosynthesis protein
VDQDCIGLFGGWSGIHVGDDAILLETLQVIQQEAPDARIQVFCSTPDVTRRLLNNRENVDIVPAFRCFTGKATQNLLQATHIVDRIQYRLQWLSLAFSLFNRCSQKPADWHSEEQELLNFVNSLHRCKVMIFSGGGYLNSHLRLSWLYPSLVLIAICHKLNIPTYLCAQTIGPLDSFKDQWLIKKTFKTLALIGVRENESVALLRKLSVSPEKLIRERDAAWQDNAQESLHPGLIEESNKIGISLQPRGEKQRCFDQKLLPTLLQQYPQLHIVLFPHAPEDVPYQKSLLAELDQTNFNRIEQFPFELDPDEHRKAVAACKLCIGTRFHFHVFALSTATPSISVYKQTKTVGIFKDLDLEKLCLDPEKFAYSVEEILLQVENILQDYPLYKKKMLENLNGLQIPPSHLTLKAALKNHHSLSRA